MRSVIAAGLTLAALIAGFNAAASAADLPARPVVRAPAPVVALFNWTGFYIGGHVGGAWGNKDWVAVGGTTHIDHDLDGFIGGGQIGFNYQVGAWVFGAEFDATWGDLKGSSLCANPTFTCSTKVEWFGTATGRIGYSWDRVLLYAKGGAAWAHDKYHTFRASPASEGNGSETRFGWTVGGGIEYAFWNAWSAKIEYAYMDFGTETVTIVNNVFGASDSDIKQRLQAVKFGINYRFGGGGPVVARY